MWRCFKDFNTESDKIRTDRWGSNQREQSSNAIKCGKVSYNNADMTRYVFRYVISRVPSVTNDCISSWVTLVSPSERNSNFARNLTLWTLVKPCFIWRYNTNICIIGIYGYLIFATVFFIIWIGMNVVQFIYIKLNI